MKKYIFSTENGFGFKTDEINKILESDIEISDEVYNKFFELQSQGKQFKVKNINCTTFEEIFEEVVPVNVPQPPCIEDRVAAIESAISALMGVQNV